MKAALIVFAKPARPGEVKTRLVSLVTEEDAARLYHAFFQDAMAEYRRMGLNEGPDIRLYMPQSGADGNGDHASFGIGASGGSAHAQRGEHLGQRMLHAFSETFAAGYEAVVIIGTDHPTLPPAFVAEAFEQLRTPRTVVLGPADDGGYYLLGMNDLRPKLFQEMAYSHGNVLEETLDRAVASGAKPVLLPRWYDVDTPEDLMRLVEDLREPAGADEEAPLLPRTRAVVDALCDRYDVLARRRSGSA